MMRILIADDHELLRDVLRSYLMAESDFEVDTVADLPAALARIEAEVPYDLILLDFAMPGMNGFAGLEAAVKEAGDRPVALMSGLAPAGVCERVLACGAAGYLPKTLPARSVVNAIRFMAAGEIYMPMETLRPRPVEAEAKSSLSSREREVLGGLCKGLSNKEIALDLELREPTIKLHVKALCRKLGARNRTHAAMIARERCLI